MRWPVFILAAVLTTAGTLLAIAYPRAMEGMPGREIGRWTVFAGGGEFLAPEATLHASDGPAVTTVDLRTSAPLSSGAGREVLTVTLVDGAGDEVARAVLGFSGAGALESPQTGVMRYRDAARLPEAAGPHRFAVEAGGDFPDSALTVELMLNAATYPVHPLARPAGIALIAVGGFCFWLGLGRRRENPNAQPPPKWGRR